MGIATAQLHHGAAAVHNDHVSKNTVTNACNDSIDHDNVLTRRVVVCDAGEGVLLTSLKESCLPLR